MRTTTQHTLAFWFALLCTGAAITGAAADEPVSPRRLGREHPVLGALEDPGTALAPRLALSGEITLADAIAAALRQSPALETFAYDVRAREALAIAAAARPNPELAVDLEDFAGSGDRKDFDASETTLSLSQLIELGGKRSRRMQLAELDTALASWDFETQRLAVLTDTTKAFVALLVQQERQALIADLEAMASDSLRSVESTVRAGAVSPVEAERARVNVERVQLEVVRNAVQLEAARSLLAATWGETHPLFGRALGALDPLPPVPDLARLESAVPESPELARWNAEVAQREAAVAFARARRVPDVRVSLGARHFSDGDDAAVVAGVSVPVPLLDLGRGSILDARHRAARAQSERRLADVSVRASLRAGHRDLVLASREVEALRDRIVPRLERVVRETQHGYATGLFRHLEVIDAQRTLFDARRELLDALVAFHFAATDLERITGAPLTELAGGATP